MQLARCPVCHNRISLEAVVQDESGRELLGLLSTLDQSTGAALVSYMGLFRSKSRDLANDRALRLAREVLDIATGPNLVAALANTVENMRTKQQAGGFKPLSNHNYLKRVLESADTSVIEALPSNVDSGSKQQRRAAVTGAVMDIQDTNW